MGNPNHAPREPYVPPAQLFGEDGLFPEFTGEEIANFGSYPPMSLNEAVKVCGEHWVPSLLEDPDSGQAIINSLLSGK